VPDGSHALDSGSVRRQNPRGGSFVREAALKADVTHRSVVVEDDSHGDTAGRANWRALVISVGFALVVHAATLARRVYWQKVRWCSALHATTTQLLWADGDTFAIEERQEITADTTIDGLLEAVRLLPGGSWSKIRGLKRDGENVVHGNATELAGIRDRLISDGQLINSAGRDGQFSLWVSDDPAAPRSDVRTGLEPASSTTPVREVDDVPVPPFPPYRERGTERNDRPGLTADFSPLMAGVPHCVMCEAPFDLNERGADHATCPACVALRHGLVIASEAGEMRLLTPLSLMESAS
jgi:hypothetical protein